MRRVRQQGQSTVEFALMMPVMLTVFFWMFEANILMTGMHLTSYASFMSARAYVVKHKHGSIARRQLRNRFIKRDAVNHVHTIRILSAKHGLIRRLALFRSLFVPNTTFTKMHQHLIDRQTMKPCRKSRLAAKASYLAEKLNESFLRQVFSLRDVLRHAQT